MMQYNTKKKRDRLTVFYCGQALSTKDSFEYVDGEHHFKTILFRVVVDIIFKESACNEEVKVRSS